MLYLNAYPKWNLDLTLENACDEKFRIYVRMLKCCEDVTSSDKGCNLMTLIGGDMGILNGKCSKNITLLYPNMVRWKWINYHRTWVKIYIYSTCTIERGNVLYLYYIWTSKSKRFNQESRWNSILQFLRTTFHGF